MALSVNKYYLYLVPDQSDAFFIAKHASYSKPKVLILHLCYSRSKLKNEVSQAAGTALTQISLSMPNTIY